MGVMIATLLLVHLLQQEKQKHFKSELDIELKRATEKVEAQMEERILALSRMARRWEVTGPLPREVWEDDVSLYYQHFKSFQAIEWADPSHHVRWIFPQRGNEAAEGVDLMSEPRRREALVRAEEGGAAEVSRTVELAQRGTGFLVFVPIVRQQRFEGTLIGVFRVQDTLETILGHDFRSRFAIKVFDGDQLIYQSQLPGVSEESGWTQEGSFRFRTVEWRVRLQPAPAWMDPLRSMLPEGVLAVGCLLSALVFVAVFLAHSARSRAQQLEELSSLHEAILDGTSFAIMSTSLDGIIRGFNKGAERMLGYSAEEVVGKVTPLAFHDAKELEERARKLSQALGREVTPDFEVLRPQVFGNGATSEWHLIRKDGSRVLIQLSIFPIRNAQGEITRFAGISFDITARKQAELGLVQAKEAAEEAARVKSDFLARMSHELRTPLSGIIGMVELTLKTALSPEQRDFLETAQDSARTLLRIINDILLFSQIEVKKLRLESTAFRLRELLQETLKPFELKAQEKRLELVMAVAQEVPEALVGDPLRLHQVLLNLLDNALKFTEAGQVRLTIEQEGQRPGRASLCFSVEDTGIGIPEHKRSLLFEAFTQADESISRRYGGTGLGLAIASQLVELMGGQLQVESRLGRGSRFHFTVEFPLASEAPAPAAVTDSAQLAGRLPALTPREVLVVEDHTVNQRIVVNLLERAGHHVSVVDTGQAAIEALRVRRYDVVLMDVHMPGMDGLETTRIIRSEEASRGGRVPIIALTAQELEGDVQRFLQAGMDGYLPKPLEPSSLLRAIDARSSVAVGVAASLLSSEVVLDPARLLQQVGGDAALMKEVVELFLAELPMTWADLEAGLAHGDARQVAKASHKIKGALLNLTAGDAANAARRLEELGHQGRLAEAAQALERLRKELARLRGALEKLSAAG